MIEMIAFQMSDTGKIQSRTLNYGSILVDRFRRRRIPSPSLSRPRQLNSDGGACIETGIGCEDAGSKKKRRSLSNIGAAKHDGSSDTILVSTTGCVCSTGKTQRERNLLWGSRVYHVMDLCLHARFRRLYTRSIGCRNGCLLILPRRLSCDSPMTIAPGSPAN